jgi:hypothetical protein
MAAVFLFDRPILAWHGSGRLQRRRACVARLHGPAAAVVLRKRRPVSHRHDGCAGEPARQDLLDRFSIAPSSAAVASSMKIQSGS